VEKGFLQFEKKLSKPFVIQIEKVISAFIHKTTCSDNFLSDVALPKNVSGKFIVTHKLKNMSFYIAPLHNRLGRGQNLFAQVLSSGLNRWA